VPPVRFARSAVAVRMHLSLLSYIGEMVGRHGAALNAVRQHLCGLRDRCIAAMLATRTQREGGVEPPQPGL
jgi:hypothetical protein